MKICFDQEHDIVNIKFQEGEYDISDEVRDGIIIDMTKDHKLMAIEILDASQKLPKKELDALLVS